MRRRVAGVIGLAMVVAIQVLLADNDHEPLPVLEGRLVAVGIPGVAAIAPVCTFLPGGPIPTKFEAYTQPGQVLDPAHLGGQHVKFRRSPGRQESTAGIVFVD